MKIKSAVLMFAALMLAFSLSITACGNKGGKDNKGDESTTSSSNAGNDNQLPKNLKIVAEYGVDNKNVKLTEIRTEEGRVFIVGDMIMYTDFNENKRYLLSQSNKTGIVENINESDKNDDTFMISKYSGSVPENKFKIGKDMVAGRVVTLYDTKALNVHQKAWVDDQYGITLKVITTADSKGKTVTILSYEVKELIVGGNRLSDVVNLKEYKITEAQ